MKFRKNLLVLPVIAAMLLTGCGAGKGKNSASANALDFSTASGDAGKDLVVSVGTEDDKEVLSQIESDFKKDNPNFPYTVKARVISESEAANKVLSDTASAPDVFTFADDQLNSLTASGILSPVTDSSVKSDNLEAAVKAASIDGKVYAYPMTADNGYFLYYNKKYFKDADLKTLDGILKVAASKNKKVTMDIANGWYLYAFFGNTGMKLTLADDGLTNVCDWNSTKNKIKGIDVISAVTSIAKNKGFKAGGDDALKAGAKDDSVIAGVSGVWLSADLQKIWGDNLGAVKMPTYTVDGQQVQMASYAGYKMVGVNSFSPKASWANKFAAYMTNQKSQTLRFEKRGQGPSNTKASESDAVKASPAIQALLAQSKYSSLQRLGQKFWDAMNNFGPQITSGNNITQKQLNSFVKQVTGAVTE
ncbi:MAG: extracellular solute-binding protein [Lachnospiraceae bacterium]|uniref:Extracellular solute-binding protein n=1 Tax=Candidatus Weimeria bifida TaxID=2599074 RepID=A0A6N7J3N7_9FIRM|nr:extracellular solute-binding protein [Candidatus Weimeria bifida]RRF96158.1 MAG: extracellular solute-binding protein [Lachnospiraceae bacterium]